MRFLFPPPVRPRLFLLLLLPFCLRAAAPELTAPAAGATLHSPHPHFHWLPGPGPATGAVHRVVIARDEACTDAVCADDLEVVHRFVPVKPLAPGRYWWRVRRGAGEWSASREFTVASPARTILIPPGSDAAAVARAFTAAQTGFPAVVRFAPGEYRLAAVKPEGVATLRGVRDVVIEGPGARILLEGTFLDLADAERVTLRDLHVAAAQPGHTLVRVTAVDAAARAITVKAEPGYDPDVARFFGGQGFLNRVDPAQPGRHLGGFVSTQTATAEPVPGSAGSFRIAPVPDSALRVQEPCALNVLTRYGSPFVNSRRTDELTFSGVTLVDMPGAFCGGSENNAKSYLGCRVVPRDPQDFQGGHSAVGDGRTGEWIEGCEFVRLADDGPNVRTMRMKVARAAGERAVELEHSWTNTDLRVGDTVAFSHPGTFATATARVVRASGRASPVRVEVDTSLERLAAAAGVTDWSGVFFYRVDPACADFVYRRNRHAGGRGHGVKYNGRRGWIADNRFEEITGNAVEIGYNWQDAYEGFGAAEVVVARNTILRCGWSPVASHGKTPLGGGYVIRDNRIEEVRDAAVMLRNCTGAVVTGNTFLSSTAPRHGAWVVTREARDITVGPNHIPAGTVEHRAR